MTDAERAAAAEARVRQLEAALRELEEANGDVLALSLLAPRDEVNAVLARDEAAWRAVRAALADAPAEPPDCPDTEKPCDNPYPHAQAQCYYVRDLIPVDALKRKYEPDWRPAFREMRALLRRLSRWDAFNADPIQAPWGDWPHYWKHLTDDALPLAEKVDI